MDNLIRTDTVFGKRVNIVGNISADLVLESLGKIYIKSRNKSLTLEEVITSLVTTDPNVSTSRVKVVLGIEGLDTSEFKEGTFVFDKLSNILYLFIDDELLELINVAPDGTSYVKRSGDTMTGRLAIYVKNGPPLYVNSDKLVENLNALYLNGETADQFTRRNKDERIKGKWAFTRPTIFEANTLFEKDIVANGSIGSLNFAGGFSGYGWRMDADTNTLTIDNLVVRKLMQVYELVVNKISATNGSLWVTNAGKVTEVQKLEIKEPSFFNTSSSEYKEFVTGISYGYSFIKTSVLLTNEAIQTIPADDLMTASGIGALPKDCWAESTLGNAKLIVITSENDDLSDDIFNDTSSLKYHIYSLFSDDFKLNCTFPIITREDYVNYKSIEANIKLLLELLENMDESDQNYQQTFDALDAAQQLYVLPEAKFVKSYFKYFANGDYYFVGFDSDSLPVFKPGDIIRCLKWTYGGIKYYDGVVCNVIGNKCVIQLALSILDKKSTVSYDLSLLPTITVQDDTINYNLYNLSHRTLKPKAVTELQSLSEEEQLNEILIGLIEKDDSIVLMGNLWDPQRQNAVYITSTDNGAPYMDVLSGLNRPDFSVIYYTPIFKTIKLHASTRKVNPPILTTGGNAIQASDILDITYSGDYYILKNPPDGATNSYCDYTCINVEQQYQGTTYVQLFLVKGYKSSITSNGGTVSILYYLNILPDVNTKLGDSLEEFNILLEDGGLIELTGIMENGNLVDYSGYYLLLEETRLSLLIASTRTTKVRLGNLDGILDELFPIDKLPYGYGLYGLNVFLVGEFYLSNGRSLAEIGYDAITFAVASQNAMYNSLELLKLDYARADKLLLNSMYTKAELKTAGMRIGKDKFGHPGIVLWGNQIIIATTQNEFDGKVDPTALFADGKIKAKFIEVNEIHSSGILGSEYYRYWLGEREVFIGYDSLTIGDMVITTLYYYYIGDNNLEVRLTETESSRVTRTIDYRTFGWWLKLDGSGYLALKNISWDKNGVLTLNSNIVLKEKGNQTSTGLYLNDINNITTFSINGDRKNKFYDWVLARNVQRITFNINNIGSLLDLVIDNSYPVKELYTINKEYTSGTLLSFTINVSSYEYYLMPSTRTPPGYAFKFGFFKSEDVVPSLIEELNIDSFSSYGYLNTQLMYDIVKIVIYDNNNECYSYLACNLDYYDSSLRSLIGSNYIGITSSDWTNGYGYYFDIKNIFWIGSDRIVQGYLHENYRFVGITIDYNGIFLHNYSSTESDQNKVNLTSISSPGQYYNLGSTEDSGRINLTKVLLIAPNATYLSVNSEYLSANSNNINLTGSSPRFIYILNNSGNKINYYINADYSAIGIEFIFVRLQNSDLSGAYNSDSNMWLCVNKLMEYGQIDLSDIKDHKPIHLKWHPVRLTYLGNGLWKCMDGNTPIDNNNTWS